MVEENLEGTYGHMARRAEDLAQDIDGLVEDYEDQFGLEPEKKKNDP